MPVLSTQTFRKAARAALSGAVIAGMASFVANVGSMTFASPAYSAEQSSTCDRIKAVGGYVGCEIKRLDRDTARLKAEGAAADIRGTQADAAKACGAFLLARVKDGTISREKLLEAAGGKPPTRENGCDVAKKFGYERAADRGSVPTAPVVN